MSTPRLSITCVSLTLIWAIVFACGCKQSPGEPPEGAGSPAAPTEPLPQPTEGAGSQTASTELLPQPPEGAGSQTASNPPSSNPAGPPSGPSAPPGLPAPDELVTVPGHPPPDKLVTVPGPPVDTGPARITFQSTVYEFGAIPEVQKAKGSFQFTNTGTGTLIIEDIKPSCGCTAIALDKYEYAPGEIGHLNVVFDPTGPGLQQKYIDVITNAEPQPVVKLIVSADVQAFLIIDPRSLDLGVIPYGREYRTSVSVSSPDREFTIDSVKTTNEHITTRVLSEEEMRRFPGADVSSGAKIVEVIVSADAPWGSLFSWLEVTIRGKPPHGLARIVHMSRIRIQGQVFGQLAIEPDTYRFGVKTGESFERRIRLTRRSGESFSVIIASVLLPDMPEAQIRLEKTDEHVWELTLTATAGPDAAHCKGTVTVKTDVPGEETVQIPIVGVVRTAGR